MEHRMHPRTPVQMRAVIYYREVPVDLGDVVDLSPAGAQLRGVSLELPVGAVVEIELRPLDTHASRGRFRGLVRHREGDRVGLFIHDVRGRGAAIPGDLLDQPADGGPGPQASARGVGRGG